jgi:hypothetical protein
VRVPFQDGLIFQRKYIVSKETLDEEMTTNDKTHLEGRCEK